MTAARAIVGRQITGVRQHRVATNTGPQWHVSAIELDDGSVLTFDVHETESLRYVVTLRRRDP